MYYIKAIDLLSDYKDQQFKVKRGKVVWETMSGPKSNGKILISRVVLEGGRPFMLGLGYQSRYVELDTLLEPQNVCPYCFDPNCTSDHK